MAERAERGGSRVCRPFRRVAGPADRDSEQPALGEESLGIMSGGTAGRTRGPGVALAIVTSAFSTAVLALIFAVYALVLVPALLTFGQLSDRLGRRVVIAIGLGLAALGLLL